MLQPEMPWPGSHQETSPPWTRSRESAFQFEASREVLRATEALQDDR